MGQVWLGAVTALAVGCSVDPAKFSCANSGECPSGYYCNVAAAHCAKGADTTAPALLASTWDKTSIPPGGTATLTFTTSKPVALATVAPETAIHNVNVGTFTAVSSGAPDTYTMAFTAPSVCDGSGANPADAMPISISLSFKDSAGNAGTGPVGQLTCNVPKTLSVNANKVHLVKQPYADGTVRSVIVTDKGAISSTPGFAGVSVIATAGSTVLASAAANADGSAAVIELPGAPTQVGLAVSDRSGHSAPVTGYAERVIMSFAGKDVPGNVNPVTAWDTGSVNDALYPPQQWVASGSGPDGGPIAELLPARTFLSDGGVTNLNSYEPFAYQDGIHGMTVVPPAPDRDGGTLLGWELLETASITAAAAVTPPARVGHALAQTSGFQVGSNYYYSALVGGAAPDIDGGFVDPAGTFYAYNQYGGVGWAQVTPPSQQPFSGSPPFASKYFQSYDPSYGPYVGLDSPSFRANVAMGPGSGANTCSGTCTDFVAYTNYFLTAGGTTATGPTNRIYAWGERTHYFTGGSRQYIGWWDLTAEPNGAPAGPVLPFANSGMASAGTFYVPTTLGPNGGGNFTPGILLVGGSANTQANNDANGCLTVAAFYGSPNPPQYQVQSCVDAAWNTSTGALGLRSGIALAASDYVTSVLTANFYLFGGAQSGSSTVTSNGAKNDLWQGTLTVACNGGTSVNPPCQFGFFPVRIATWTNVTPSTGPKPPTRSGAAMAFGDSRRLLLYGGVSATGTVLTDMWELDMNVIPVANWQWRQIGFQPAPAMAPSPRTKFVAYGQGGGQFLLYGGSSGGAPLNDVWSLTKEAPARMLIQAPTGLSSPSSATSVGLTLTVNGPTTSYAPLYAWDGSTWNFVGRPFQTPSIYGLANPTAYIQPDGNIYLMFMTPTGYRNPPGSQYPYNVVSFDSMEAILDFK